jgi:hypothetical protein
MNKNTVISQLVPLLGTLSERAMIIYKDEKISSETGSDLTDLLVYGYFINKIK